MLDWIWIGLWFVCAVLFLFWFGRVIHLQESLCDCGHRGGQHYESYNLTSRAACFIAGCRCRMFEKGGNQIMAGIDPTVSALHEIQDALNAAARNLSRVQYEELLREVVIEVEDRQLALEDGPLGL